MRLHLGIEPQAFLPMGRDIRKAVFDCVLEQIGRFDFLCIEPVQHRAHFARQPEQGGCRRHLSLCFCKSGRDMARKLKPALCRLGRWRDIGLPQGVEQRAKALIQIKIADHHHARHQHSAFTALAIMTHERLGHSASSARAGQQERGLG